MIVKFLRLPKEDRRPLLSALLLLPLVRWGLVWFGFRRCWSWLRRTSPAQPDSPIRTQSAAAPSASASAPNLASPEAVVRAVQRVATHVPGTYACLPRALTTWWLLRRRGHAPELRLGVHLQEPDRQVTSSERLDAHAWVELNGRALGEAEDIEQQFTILDPDLERKIQ